MSTPMGFKLDTNASIVQTALTFSQKPYPLTNVCTQKT